MTDSRFNSRENQADGRGMLFLLLLRAILTSQASLAIENLALRQQVAVLKRSVPRPHLGGLHHSYRRAA